MKRESVKAVKAWAIVQDGKQVDVAGRYCIFPTRKMAKAHFGLVNGESIVRVEIRALPVRKVRGKL